MAGVIFISYIDSKKSTSRIGHEINIFRNVVEYSFLGEQIGFLEIELIESDSKYVYIPISNIGFMEYFESESKFDELYKNIK